MQRKNLILVDKASGSQQAVSLTAARQRIILSGREGEGLTLRGLAPGTAVALMADHDTLTIEPDGQATPFSINASVASQSPLTLTPGDRIGLGEITLTYDPTVSTHRFIISTGADMETADETTPPEAAAVAAVKPMAFEPRTAKTAARRKRRGRLGLMVLALPAMLLTTAAWFVFTARQLELRIDPPPEKIMIRGGLLTPRLGPAYLLRPGDYQLHAVRPGYQDLNADFQIGAAKHQALEFTMEKLPGRINLTTHREDQPAEAVTGAVVEIDGQPIGQSPLAAAEVPAGHHEIHLQAPLYKPKQEVITVAGEGQTQTFTFGLAPNWADVSFTTTPPGAWVKILGRRLGQTPLTAPVEAGDHKVSFYREGYKPAEARIRVVAGQTLAVSSPELERFEGRLFINSRPGGANVTVDKEFFGQTPIDITLAPDREHVVRISEPGYRTAVHRVTVASGARTSVAADLVPRRGQVRFRVSPPDARLVVDGHPHGQVPAALDLLAVTHQILIVKDGYRDYRTQVTPRPGHTLELRVDLKRPYETDVPGIIKASNGYRLKLIQPAAQVFRMGTSRREPGRRANETLREIRLRRPFYIGLKEITNREFREFQRAHDAGLFENYSLNRNEQPVVQVTWEQAAAFCNWLSQREGLPRAYEDKKGGGLKPVVPLNHGYRLPTEAEWVFCARVDAAGAVTKYPWGDTFPPADNTANLADKSAQTILQLFLENYLDGHPVAAPPGSLRPNHLGLFDLGGNVSEWCHDYYQIYPYAQGKVTIDPTGPATGRHHVIRGGSWKQASIQTLRAAYRNYQEDKHMDLGFRVCRYVKPSREDE
jgi:formylglycine-generating enzyme required for sulfatase activity